MGRLFYFLALGLSGYMFHIIYTIIFLATHHSFMDDEQLTASDRRKTYQKNIKSGKGHSLDDASVASHSTGGLKAAASESQLNETDSFLSPPKEKRTSSKLSLLADKVSREVTWNMPYLV